MCVPTAGTEQGRARGIRGRLFPFVSCDSEGDQITLLGSYSLLLDRIPRQLADMVSKTHTRGTPCCHSRATTKCVVRSCTPKLRYVCVCVCVCVSFLQEWDTRGHAADIKLSSNCLTATKTSSNHPSTVHGTILYRGM